jgi:hypothetical protein
VPSSTRNILIGLALGLLAGLFLGEKAEVFQFVVRGYVGLLQMTVLPYVLVSLLAGIGRIDGAWARLLFVRVGTLSLVEPVHQNFKLANGDWNNSRQFQPVLPLGLTKDWNLNTRLVMPFYNIVPHGQFERTAVGDLTLLELLSPAR